jgi:NADPH-dependent curcumin reductase CurA
MEQIKNKQIVLASRPTGWVEESNFRLVETILDAPDEDEVLVRNSYLSLDPYMRMRMDAVKSYAPYVELGQVMVGGTVGEVLESNYADLKPGDLVTGSLGWQLYGITKGKNLRKVETTKVPLSAYLGIVGMPGVTAWYGLNEIGQPKAGETVVVSAASGAVGSVVGQLAKMKGCRVVGIAGGKAKCDYVVEELGFDACIDYKSPDFKQAFESAIPDGVDVYFDNVGGEILDLVLASLNPFSRIALCGVISQYNQSEPHGIRNARSLLVNRARLQGFIISDHLEKWAEILPQLENLVATGRLKYRESVAEGLENAPTAFIGMLKGENFGKQVVKLT